MLVLDKGIKCLFMNTGPRLCVAVDLVGQAVILWLRDAWSAQDGRGRCRIWDIFLTCVSLVWFWINWYRISHKGLCLYILYSSMEGNIFLSLFPWNGPRLFRIKDDLICVSVRSVLGSFTKIFDIIVGGYIILNPLRCYICVYKLVSAVKGRGVLHCLFC